MSSHAPKDVIVDQLRILAEENDRSVLAEMRDMYYSFQEVIIEMAPMMSRDNYLFTSEEMNDLLEIEDHVRQQASIYSQKEE